MTTSIWHAEDTQAVREVDFLVVGAGLIGCSSAYFAAQAGREVIITDQYDVALGASGRNAGFMITGLDTYYHHAIEKYGEAVTRETWALSERTLSFWRQIVAQSAGAVRYEPSGSMLLAESLAEAEDLKRASEAMQAAGISHIFHANDPLGRGYHAAIEQPQDGAVQPYELTRELLRRSGASFIPNNELYRIEQTQADYVTVYTRQFVFRAQTVLLCTNAYSALIDPFFVGRVVPTRAQCLVTAPLPERPLPGCGYSDYGYMYYRTTFDGRLLIGGGRKQNKALENDTTEDRISQPVQATLDAYLQAYFPEVKAPVERRWAGIMGFSVDGLPQVGTLPDKPRVGYAVGFTGHGLSMGAGTAERAVAHMLHGTHAGVVDASRLDGVARPA